MDSLLRQQNDCEENLEKNIYVHLGRYSLIQYFGFIIYTKLIPCLKVGILRGGNCFDKDGSKVES